jgi:hypothetical protein
MRRTLLAGIRSSEVERVRGYKVGRTRTVLCVVVAALALGALVAPAVVAAPAEQIVIRLVDEPADLEFEDPCTGEAVHGVGFETGILRITDLGDQGHHQRVTVRGVADLFDSEDNFVGTWTYRLRFIDQFPPDGQGAVHLIAVGPLEYADGHTAIVRVLFEHQVFGKGDILKREFSNASCGGG